MAVLCAGSPVISAGYRYFSFYDAFYKVWQLKKGSLLEKNYNCFYCEFLFQKKHNPKTFFQFFGFIFKLKLRAVFSF